MAGRDFSFTLVEALVSILNSRDRLSSPLLASEQLALISN
jgi:hypothetical protein